ncbi:hypothetical protein [Sorangium sp. So ce388]|uniref:hypothetical protein n=1 Tax=Sorangium sp. So ce388 TaxID=3133309 RepID=UPI003F5BDFB2
MLLLGGASATPVLGGHYHPGDANWTTMSIEGTRTESRVAVALNLEGGLGLVRGSSESSANRIRYTRWSYSREIWSELSWIGSESDDVNIIGSPALASEAQSISASYLVDDAVNSYQYAAFSGGTWITRGELVENVTSATSSPGITVLPTGNPAVVFAVPEDSVQSIKVKERAVPPAWVNDAVLSPSGSSTVPASVVALRGGSGADLLVVFVSPSRQILWTRRTGPTAWSTPRQIGTHTTSDQVALAALDGGSAVVAYRSNSGRTGRLFTSFFIPSDAGSWSDATERISGSRIVGSPALTHGVGAASVELAYVLDATADGTGTSGAIRHIRCTAMTSGVCSAWSSPVSVGTGTGFTSVAIASMP